MRWQAGPRVSSSYCDLRPILGTSRGSWFVDLSAPAGAQTRRVQCQPINSFKNNNKYSKTNPGSQWTFYVGNLLKEKEWPEEAAHTHADLLEPKSILYINFTLKPVLIDSKRTSRYFVKLPMGPISSACLAAETRPFTVSVLQRSWHTHANRCIKN